METGITPVARLDEDEVRSVLAAADSAPSPPGRRPWRFRCTSEAIELYGDPDDHDGTLASGGALLNLRLAVHDLGVHADVRLAPDPARPELLAVVRPDNDRPATTRERQLVRVILDPNRIVGEPASILPPPVVQELRRAAEIEHAWLVPLDEDRAAALGDAVTGAHLVVVVGSLHDDVRGLLRAGQAVRRVDLTAALLGLRTVAVLPPMATTDAGRTDLRTLIGGALSPHAVLSLWRDDASGG